MIQRELNDRERRALNLCQRFEEAVERRQLTISLWANQETVNALQKAESKLSSFRVLTYQYDTKKGQYRVNWTLVEFNKYLSWVLSLVGMSLMIDGSLRTQDGLTITNECIQ